MNEILRHGAYICLSGISGDSRKKIVEKDAGAVAESFGFSNEFEASHSENSFALLLREDAKSGEIQDEDFMNAQCILHVASPSGDLVTHFTERAKGLFTPLAKIRILAGVVRPASYTSQLMHNFAYANQIEQQHGSRMPNAFLIPTSKTQEWWQKDWMERHTYFLPRYDESGNMLNQGHALSAASGIPALLRRTYKHPELPAPAGGYDFINYFECSDENISTFQEVCNALRDIKRNPEWKFVREGPMWHGKRVETWADLIGQIAL